MWDFICVYTTLMTSLSPCTGQTDSGTLGSLFDMLGTLPKEWEGRYKWPHHYPEEKRRRWCDHSRDPEDSLGEFLDRTSEDIRPRGRQLILGG